MGEAASRTSPPWTHAGRGRARRPTGGADADQAARRLDPGERQEPGAGDLHASRRRRSWPASRPSAWKCCPTRACRRRGRAGRPNGNFVLNEFKVTVGAGERRQGGEAGGVAARRRPTSRRQTSPSPRPSTATPANAAGRSSPQFGKPHVAVFEFEGAARLAEGARADVHDGCRSSAQAAQHRQVPPVGDDGEAADLAERPAGQPGAASWPWSRPSGRRSRRRS